MGATSWGDGLRAAASWNGAAIWHAKLPPHEVVAARDEGALAFYLTGGSTGTGPVVAS